MKISQSTTKMWSRIGSRATYGLSVLEMAKKYENFMVVTGDTSTSAGLDRFKNKFPERYIDVGIAEQNMIGVATGLASEGMMVYTSTFSPFQTMRCCEQIKVNAGYMNHKICMVGLASGLVLGMLGYTHCCIEDIGVLRSIPNISIISPADCTSTVKAVSESAMHPNSVYIRLTGGAPNPTIYHDDFDFKIGAGITLKEGNDIAIIANGTMVHKSLEASELLSEGKIDCTVVDMHTVKPIDCDLIDKLSTSHKLIVTIEEHNIIGGLGSAVSEYISSLDNAPPLLKVGIQDEYGSAGSYETLLKQKKLLSDQIANMIANRYYSI
ncbi:MAG: transketolase [Legionellales bacterium]|nr:transketolase [Legionellales bacterium]|tara:strand:+ start:7025 stop:7996 length:972 start_codon:yes stop_codon:yes gene_type:complete